MLKFLGTFHVVKIFRNLGSVENGKRFVGSSPWKIPGKSGKSKKVGLFSWAELSNRISCSIYTFLILYTSFNKLFPTRQPSCCLAGWPAWCRSGGNDQMEQLFTYRKIHFCLYWNFRKAPLGMGFVPTCIPGSKYTPWLASSRSHCWFANQAEGKFEMSFQEFVESIGAQNKDLGTASQTLLTGVRLVYVIKWWWVRLGNSISRAFCLNPIRIWTKRKRNYSLTSREIHFITY